MGVEGEKSRDRRLFSKASKANQSLQGLLVSHTSIKCVPACRVLRVYLLA